MGMCKGCNTVFSTNDMNYGYCNNCLETVDKDKAKDEYISKTSKVVELVKEGKHKKIKLNSYVLSLFIEIYLLFLGDWKNFLIFLIVKIFLIYTLLILHISDLRIFAYLLIPIYTLLTMKLSYRLYLRALLKKGFNPIDNANKLTLEKIGVFK